MASHKQHNPHHRHGHHPLSSKVSTDHEGWTEGIASLTEAHTATQLLDELPEHTMGRYSQKVGWAEAAVQHSTI
jgi:hypothetical protein